MKLFTDDELKAALKACGGARALAAERLGVTRNAVYQRIDGNPDLEEFIKDIGRTLIDAAEAVVFEAVSKKDRHMTKFVLLNHPEAKRRGWGARTEVSGPDGGAIPVGPLRIIIEYVDPTEDVI